MSELQVPQSPLEPKEGESFFRSRWAEAQMARRLVVDVGAQALSRHAMTAMGEARWRVERPGFVNCALQRQGSVGQLDFVED